MVLIFAAPPAPPVPPQSVWQGLEITWEGPDGSLWDLNDWESGVLLYAGDLVGMHFPKVTSHTSQSRVIPGHRVRGWRAEARQVFWPVFIYGDGSAEWRARQEAFLSTLHPSDEGTWRVKAGSQVRSLRLRGVFNGDHSYTFDPMLEGWGRYGVELEAARPYWAGEPVVRGPWASGSPELFIPEESGVEPPVGPPFYISSSQTLGNAAIPNEGDVEAWPVWTVVGPFTDLELGVDASVIVVPFALSEGEVLRIDTDPRNPTATVDGVDATAALGLQEYAPVPPGGSVDLHVTGSGSGSVSCSVTPLYFRAF